MRQIVTDFNNSVGLEKHIYVQYVSMSSIDEKTRISTAAGVLPDIAGVWDVNLVQYAALDALEPWTIWRNPTALLKRHLQADLLEAAQL